MPLKKPNKQSSVSSNIFLSPVYCFLLELISSSIFKITSLRKLICDSYEIPDLRQILPTLFSFIIFKTSITDVFCGSRDKAYINLSIVVPGYSILALFSCIYSVEFDQNLFKH